MTSLEFASRITRVHHLLLIAGPSAAGKKTFTEKLARRELPASVMERLPAGAARWPQSNGRKWVRNSTWTAKSGPDVPGLCLRYDILRPFDSPVTDYGSDISLRLLRAAGKVTLVMVSAPPEQLAKQLLDRAQGGETAEKWRRRQIKRTVARLPNWFRSGAVMFLNSRRRRDREMWRRRHVLVAGHYLQPGWLDRWLLQWLRYLEVSLGPRLVRPVIHVRPVLTAERRASFEIDDSPQAM